MNNTTRLDDLNDINLPQEYDQDQRETSLDNLSETHPNHASHQPETVPHGSEGETAMDTTEWQECTKNPANGRKHTTT